jgi:hypothetical protein
MTRRIRRFHLDISPRVRARLRDRAITFVGLSFLRGVVMVEYQVDPPFGNGEGGSGRQQLIFDVTDDTSADPYPTMWEDFEWPWISAGRTTTRLDRRPPPAATRLYFVVRAVDDRENFHISPPGAIVRFDVALPSGHAEPWPDRPDASPERS